MTTLMLQLMIFPEIKIYFSFFILVLFNGVKAIDSARQFFDKNLLRQ
jgi:hypothetical protein